VSIVLHFSAFLNCIHPFSREFRSIENIGVCLCFMNRIQDKITIIDKTSFEIVVKFKYLGRKLKKQSCTHEEMKNR
jgi:hypothetical protein